MFCGFEGAPNIARLFGTGRTILPDSPEWPELLALFPTYPGTRQIITADITLAQTSCGFAVPLYDYVGERDTLTKWVEAKGEDGLIAYRQEKNVCSLDNLPAPLGR